MTPHLGEADLNRNFANHQAAQGAAPSPWRCASQGCTPTYREGVSSPKKWGVVPLTGPPFWGPLRPTRSGTGWHSPAWGAWDDTHRHPSEPGQWWHWSLSTGTVAGEVVRRQ